MKKLFSIITIVKNAENLVQDTILSVLGQSCKDFEYTIIDGDSEDNTIGVVRDFEYGIKNIISENDKGIYYAMNRGRDISKGDYILYMNAGDTFANINVLENIKAEILKLDKSPDVIYGDVILKSGVILKNQKAKDLKYIFKGMCFCHQSVFVKNELICFDTHYKLAADYNLFFKLYKNNHTFHYLPIPISIYDTNGLSNSLTALVEQFKVNLLNSFSFRAIIHYLPRIIYNYIKNA